MAPTDVGVEEEHERLEFEVELFERGVAYQRYDGHYGLITPSDDASASWQ